MSGMATDGPDPAPCDRDIYTKGQLVCVIVSVSSNRLERFIQSVAKSTGTRTDWHFVGGRACVKTLDDVKVVREAIRSREAEIVVLQRETDEASGYSSHFAPSPTSYPDED